MSNRFVIYEKSYKKTFLKSKIIDLFKKFFKRSSLSLFLKGNDVISVEPLLFGQHEESMNNFLSFNANKEMNDYLIDIGANIGLTTCSNVDKFKKIFCFEPNPLVYRILQSNTDLYNSDKKIKTFNYGLGEKDGTATLIIPSKNFGGAWIDTNINAYDQKTILKKEGCSIEELKDFIRCKVEVKNTDLVIKNLFESLVSDKLFNGVIKIDVEGYELHILKSIAMNIPKEIKCSIIFELWDGSKELQKIKNFFKGDITLYQLKSIVPFPNKKNIFFKILRLIVFGKTKILLEKIENVNVSSNQFVIEIN